MTKITYEIVEHDGGWAYRADGVFSETFPSHDKARRAAERAAKEGRHVVVAGNPDHPEMIGVVGYAPNNTFVVRDAEEVRQLPALHAPLVVSQTTLKLKTFLEVAEAVKAKADAEPQVVNTICSATRDRQDAARPVSGPATRALPQLALDVDAQGYLIAQGDYMDPVGPDEWSRPG